MSTVDSKSMEQVERPGMSLKHKRILLNNRRKLRDQLDVSKVIPVIQSVEVGENERILDEYDVANIKTEKTRFDKAEKLLDILPDRGERAFDEFVKALLEMQPHLGELLSNADKTYEEEASNSEEIRSTNKTKSNKRPVSGEDFHNSVQVEPYCDTSTSSTWSSGQAAIHGVNEFSSLPPAPSHVDTPTTLNTWSNRQTATGVNAFSSLPPATSYGDTPTTLNTWSSGQTATGVNEFSSLPPAPSHADTPTTLNTWSSGQTATRVNAFSILPPAPSQRVPSNACEDPDITDTCLCDDGSNKSTLSTEHSVNSETLDQELESAMCDTLEKGHDITDTAFGQNLQFEKNLTLVTGLEPDSFYDMKTDERGKRGKALIINNKTFTIQLRYKYKERKGTDIDAQALKELFTKLLYEVIVEKNKTKNQIRDIMRKHTSETDHSRYSSFVFIVLGHGTEGKVLGTDGEIDIKELANMARDTESLIGKPKLFFIQACQGSEYMSGRDVPDGLPEKEQVQLPAEADFLYAYSTVPGYFSCRNKNEGSWFIQDVVKIFYKWAKSLDIVRMLTRVNKEIATRKSDENNTMQISTIVSNLRKELYFFPEEVVGAQIPPNPQQPGIQGVEDMDCVDNNTRASDP